MAEVYTDKAGHKSNMTWMLYALIAIIALAIIVALVR
jgi:hypothetical protein